MTENFTAIRLTSDEPSTVEMIVNAVAVSVPFPAFAARVIERADLRPYEHAFRVPGIGQAHRPRLPEQPRTRPGSDWQSGCLSALSWSC